MKQKFQVQKLVISNNIKDLTICSKFEYDADGKIYISNLTDGK